MGAKEYGWSRIIPKTGQATSYKTGDDGTYKWGSKVSPRFVDTGNNTVIDYALGLEWIKEPAKIIPNGTGAISSAEGSWANATGYTAGDLAMHTYDGDVSYYYPPFYDDHSYTTGDAIYHDNGSMVNVLFTAKSSFLSSDYEPNTGLNWATKWTKAPAPGSWMQYSNYTTALLAKFGSKFGMFASGDYAGVSNSADFDFGTGDFTIDWWEYRLANSSACSAVCRDNNSYTGYLLGYCDGNSHLQVYMTSTGSSWNMASAKSLGNLQLNGWHHFAIVRSGNIFYTFQDGVQKDTWSSALAPRTGTSDMLICDYAGYTGFPGYMQELRVSKGIARWTSGFTPPSSPYTTDSYTKLLLHMSADFTDSSASNHTVTLYGNAHIGDASSYVWDGISSTYYHCKLSHYAGDYQPGSDPLWTDKWTDLMASYWYFGSNYSVGDYTIDSTALYKCKTAHYSGNYEPYTDFNWNSVWQDLMPWSWYTYSYYYSGEYINYSGTLYKCLADNYSGDYQPYSDPNWYYMWYQPMLSAWADATYYYNGSSYVTDSGAYYQCKQDHYSSQANDEPGAGTNWTDYWTLITTSTWTANHSYTSGDYVTLSGSLYLCESNHFSGNHEPGVGSGWASYWQSTSTNAWTADHSYTTSSGVITHYGYYICTTNHFSGTREPNVGSGWGSYWDSVTFGEWASDTSYALNAVVSSYVYMYGTIYAKCKVAHTSANHQPGVSTGWATYWDDYTLSAWAIDTDYTTTISDVVTHSDSNFYTCIGNHRSSNHEPIARDDWASYWTEGDARSFSSWTYNNAYNSGDIIYIPMYMNNRYFKCLSNHTSTYTDQPWTGSGWTDKWEYLHPLYVCILGHTSGVASEPGFGASTDTYWVRTHWIHDASGLTTPEPYENNYGIVLTEGLTYNGHNNWRMPNYFEITSLLDFSTTNPMINATIFPNTVGGEYWSASTDHGNTDNAYVINFYTNGGIYMGGNTEIKYGRGMYDEKNVYVRPCRPL